MSVGRGWKQAESKLSFGVIRVCWWSQRWTDACVGRGPWLPAGEGDPASGGSSSGTMGLSSSAAVGTSAANTP